MLRDWLKPTWSNILIGLFLLLEFGFQMWNNFPWSFFPWAYAPSFILYNVMSSGWFSPLKIFVLNVLDTVVNLVAFYVIGCIAYWIYQKVARRFPKVSEFFIWNTKKMQIMGFLFSISLSFSFFSLFLQSYMHSNISYLTPSDFVIRIIIRSIIDGVSTALNFGNTLVQEIYWYGFSDMRQIFGELLPAFALSVCWWYLLASAIQFTIRNIVVKKK